MARRLEGQEISDGQVRSHGMAWRQRYAGCISIVAHCVINLKLASIFHSILMLNSCRMAAVHLRTNYILVDHSLAASPRLNFLLTQLSQLVHRRRVTGDHTLSHLSCSPY